MFVASKTAMFDSICELFFICIENYKIGTKFDATYDITLDFCGTVKTELSINEASPPLLSEWGALFSSLHSTSCLLRVCVW